MTIRRWQKLTSQAAMLASDGRKFDDVGIDRTQTLVGV
jgi:hypothetical protein